MAEKLTRDQMRERIFATKNRKSVIVEDFYGTTLELRSPTLGDILGAQDNASRQEAVIGLIIKFAYVPDTDERVFDDADADSLRALPFGPDFLRLNTALESLTDVNFQAPSGT